MQLEVCKRDGSGCKIIDTDEILRITTMMDNAEVQVLSAESFDKLEELVNAPANPSPALVDLMTRPRKYIVEK